MNTTLTETTAFLAEMTASVVETTQAETVRKDNYNFGRNYDNSNKKQLQFQQSDYIWTRHCDIV